MAAISPRDVLATARHELGTTEKPADSNRTKYGAAYGWNGVPWCGIFVWWVINECGINLRKHGITSPVSTNAFDAEAKAAGWKPVDRAHALPGDIVFYNFGDLDGPGPDTATDNDHVGFVSKPAASGWLHAIEGNTAPGNTGSQANGGGVFERHRPLTVVRHVYRPPFEAWSLELASRTPTQKEPAVAASLTASDIADAVIERLAAAKVVPSTNRDGKAITATIVDVLRALNQKANEETARDAALLEAVRQISGGGALDVAAVEAAADRALAKLGQALTSS